MRFPSDKSFYKESHLEANKLTAPWCRPVPSSTPPVQPEAPKPPLAAGGLNATCPGGWA